MSAPDKRQQTRSTRRPPTPAKSPGKPKVIFTIDKAGPKRVSSGPKAGDPIPTTLKLTEDTKARARAAAADAGLTLHAWMVDAVEKAAEQSDKWRSFMAEADEAEDEFERTGEGYEAKEMFRYYEEKAAGRNPPHPKPVKWR